MAHHLHNLNRSGSPLTGSTTVDRARETDCRLLDIILLAAIVGRRVDGNGRRNLLQQP